VSTTDLDVDANVANVVDVAFVDGALDAASITFPGFIDGNDILTSDLRQWHQARPCTLIHSKSLLTLSLSSNTKRVFIKFVRDRIDRENKFLEQIVWDKLSSPSFCIR